MAEYIEVCEQAARAGGAELLDWRERFTVREKGPADLVTDADLASQDAIRETVMRTYPRHGFLSEEAPEVPSATGFRWIVDPLDGTTNYAHQAPGYAVSIALEREGELIAATVFDPLADECFTATAGGGSRLNGRPIRVSSVNDLNSALVAVSFPRGVAQGDPELEDFLDVLATAQAIRRLGSAALNLSYLAAGRFDAYWTTNTRIWDVAAGVLLVREAGGFVTQLEPPGCEELSLDLSRPRFVVSSTRELQAQLRGKLVASATAANRDP